MPLFEHEGFELNYLDEGQGDPVLLIHGFASNMRVNWVEPGWVKTLTEAGYRVLAFDHRGHGASSKSHDQAAYHPSKLAGDAAALLAHAGVPRAHVFGYSMGARTTAFMALEHADAVATVIFGGLGIGLVDGVGDWVPIIEGLLAEDAATVTLPQPKMFRSFADRTRSDRLSLAVSAVTVWRAIRRLGLSFKKRPSTPANKSARM